VLRVIWELLIATHWQRLVHFDQRWLLLFLNLLSLIFANGVDESISPVHVRIIFIEEGEHPFDLIILCIVAFGLVLFTVA